MQYIKVRFTYGLKGTAYQCVDDYGNLLEHRDLSGELMELPFIYECEVTDVAPDFPLWGVKGEGVPATSYGTTKVGDKVILGKK